jgi:riboflavin kinase/FMN adenylyltransferase
LEERVALLQSLGVDSVSVLSFSSELAQLSYYDFMALLVSELGLKLLVVGPDFAVGRDRKGDAAALQALGDDRGFEVVVAQMLAEDDAKVGSAAVRDALARGDMAVVQQLLGRAFALRGPVVRGAERGRTIGFPTANIAVAPDLALPPFGVYVTRAFLGESSYESVTNIGKRPTFDENRPTIEVHLFGFDGDCYEQEMRIDVLHRLRDEQRFDGVPALVAQIKRDVSNARSFFAAPTTGSRT